MTTNKQARKERPIASGVLAYFPDAIAEVAHVSYVGNQQHNPGQPMHWDRSKSGDHADCVARHLLERGTMDDDGLRHSAKAAWRALALLQEELEKPTASFIERKCISERAEKGTIAWMESLLEAANGIPPVKDLPLDRLLKLGCPETVAKQVAGGMTPQNTILNGLGWVYIAGPMRGYEKFNFPAFDEARFAFCSRGFNVISPADVDRQAHANADDPTKVDTKDQTVYAFRDFWAIYFIAKNNPTGKNGIVLLPGWTKSTGAVGEFFLARWLGLKFYYADGREAHVSALVHDFALTHATLAAKES